MVGPKQSPSKFFCSHFIGVPSQPCKLAAPRLLHSRSVASTALSLAQAIRKGDLVQVPSCGGFLSTCCCQPRCPAITPDSMHAQSLDLGSSTDLVCNNLLCEKVGEPCICRLSRALERLPSLARLDLSSNGLTALPDSLCTLQHLQHLDVSRNQLSALPACVWAMPQLRLLDVRGNAGLVGSADFAARCRTATFQVEAGLL